jgi:hypothetical protein
VGAPAVEPEEAAPFARAARALADAVGGLLGTSPDPTAPGGAPSAAGGLKDVLGAVAGAAAAWRERRGASAAGSPDPDAGSRTPGAFLGDLLSAAAPRLPIRDRDRLRAAYPGLSDGDIAEALVARSARLTAAIGAATGGIAAAQWFATPSLLALPLQLGAETVLIAGVEVVLLGELHELHGRPAPGDARTRAAAYLASWSEQRAVDGAAAGSGLLSVLGTAGLRSVSRRLSRRMAKGIPVAAPFLLGAAVAGRGNRRATEILARRVLGDLRAAPGGRG